MVVFPNAKINIGLNVFPSRPDGYHELETVMVAVPWRDVLEIVPAGSGVLVSGGGVRETVGKDSLTVFGRKVDCPAEKNLVMKAVRVLRETVDFPAVDIYLEKVIPDGAGLGGGSADAAFTLKALNDLFGLRLSKERLAEIASGIGADCPFFIYDTPMLCKGIGTEMTPLKLDLPKGMWVAIVKPQSGVSTKEAYAGVNTLDPAAVAPLSALLSETPVDEWQGKVRNSFEETVFALLPDVARIKERLIESGAVYASMSGSGSAVYALFSEKISKSSLQEKFPDCSCFASKFS